MSTIVCVTMRYGSRRFPGKALVDLGCGFTPVSLLSAQLFPVPYRMVLCVPDGVEGDRIADHAAKLGVTCHRGSLVNVLGRMLSAAERFGADTVIRITGDDLFVDPWRLNRLVEAHRDRNADLTYSDLPKGTECQVMSVAMLRRMVASAGDDTECWDKQCDAEWMVGSKLHFAPLSPVTVGSETFAVELDTPDDAEVIRDVLHRLGETGHSPPIRVEDLAAMHAKRPFPKTKYPVYQPRTCPG